MIAFLLSREHVAAPAGLYHQNFQRTAGAALCRAQSVGVALLNYSIKYVSIVIRDCVLNVPRNVPAVNWWVLWVLAVDVGRGSIRPTRQSNKLNKLHKIANT